MLIIVSVETKMECSEKRVKNMILKYVQIISLQKNFKWIVMFFFVSMFLIDNPWFGQKHMEAITGGVGMIDMNWFNSPNEIIDYLRTIGDQGRRAYMLVLCMDCILIASLFSFSGSLIYRSLKSIGISESYAWLIYIPFLRAVFDILETLALMLNTLLYPKANYFFISLASVSTPFKWIFMVAMLAIILILLGVRNYKKIKSNKVKVR